MNSDPSAIGIMEGAFFVSKSELLEWLRGDFGMQISKIEECGTGVVYLRIMDRLFPGKVPLRKLKHGAKQEWECLHNLKLLQSVFTECGVKKQVDIDRLAKCLYSDNLEFLQWMKRFHDRKRGSSCNTSGPVYPKVSDGSGCRVRPSPRSPLQNSLRGNPCTSGYRPATHLNSGGLARHDNSSSTVVKKGASRPLGNYSTQTPTSVTGGMKRYGQRQVREQVDWSVNEEVEALRELVEQKTHEIETLQEEIDNVEKERKLRKLEIMSGEENRETFSVSEVQHILFTETDVGEELFIDEQDNETICHEPLKLTDQQNSLHPDSIRAPTHGLY